MQKMYFLVGLMGCGKTWWGQRLAERLNLPFVDLDEQIEAGAGMSISDIFDRMGEAGFRRLEREHLRCLAAMPGGVVALGGGAPCFFDNLEWMKAHGIVIYLDTPVSLIVARLAANHISRPLLADTPGHELQNRLEEILRQREPFYRQAHITIEQRGDADMLPLLEAAIGKFHANGRQ